MQTETGRGSESPKVVCLATLVANWQVRVAMLARVYLQLWIHHGYLLESHRYEGRCRQDLIIDSGLFLSYLIIYMSTSLFRAVVIQLPNLTRMNPLLGPTKKTRRTF